MIRTAHTLFFATMCGFWLVVPVVPVAAQASSPSLVASIEASRPSPYENEIFHLTLTIRATGMRLGQDVELINLPETNRLELGTFRELQPQRRIEEGDIVDIRRYQCTARAFAQGLMKISPKVRLTLLIRRSISFFMGTWVETRQELPVSPLEIDVRPLPLANRPPEFSGAVGQFDFNVYVAPTNVAVDELVSVVMEITGEGYWPKDAQPRIPKAPYFRVYDPQPVAGRKGGRAFKQILIPQSTNVTCVPAVTWSYFDPARESYVTITRGPFPLALQPRREVQVQRMYVPSGTGPAETTSVPLIKRRIRLSSSDRSSWEAAQKAIDNGEFSTAIDLYQRLLDRHPRAAEIYCNLGTVYFLRDDYGRAILNYYRAHRLAPRDGETRQNLVLTVRRSGADGWEKICRETLLPPGPLQVLSTREWSFVLAAVIAVIIVAVLALFMRCIKTWGRRASLLLVIPASLVAAISILAIITEIRLVGREVVVIERCTAHVTPASSSLVSFVCPAGTRGLVLGRISGWVRIAVGPKIGWSQESNVVPVVESRKHGSPSLSPVLDKRSNAGLY